MKDTAFQKVQTIRSGNRLLNFDRPLVMGILNVTPDSFYDGGQHHASAEALKQAAKMIEHGADIIDVGGYSTRPGAREIPVKDEIERVATVIQSISEGFPETTISIDTFRSEVAREAISRGAHWVNDISGGQFDEDLFPTVAKLGVPYVLMHIKGTPQTMQRNPRYDDVIGEVTKYFSQRINELRNLGVNDIILDPGFGFGKSVEHNYTLLRNFHELQIFDAPLLCGVSRKSMITRLLDVKPKDALNGTTALHIFALQQGAKILRVHDVKEAVQAIKIWQAYSEDDFFAES